MVVDDTPANLRLLEHMLQSLGHRVLAFPSGRMALNAMRRNAPDLILLDISMPDMDGFEVCRRLKDDASLRDIPVLFISALMDVTDKVRGFEAGGVDYITKPFQFEELQIRIQTQLELRRQRLQLAESLRKQQEAELMRDSLAQLLVHDLRSPLTALLCNLDLAMMHQPADEVKDALACATQAARSLMHMVNNLLDVGHLEEGRLEPDLQVVELDALAREALTLVDSLRGGRRLLLEVPGEVPALVADRDLVLRVLQNLLGNAIKYTDEFQGRVTIRLLETSAGARVEVCDNGRGIPAEDQPRVFDKFYQVEARQKRRPHSSGLGLTFCKLAVELHGGSIGVTSEEGIGSVFCFELPSRPLGWDTAEEVTRHRSDEQHSDGRW